MVIDARRRQMRVTEPTAEGQHDLVRRRCWLLTQPIQRRRGLHRRADLQRSREEQGEVVEVMGVRGKRVLALVLSPGAEDRLRRVVASSGDRERRGQRRSRVMTSQQEFGMGGLHRSSFLARAPVTSRRPARAQAKCDSSYVLRQNLLVLSLWCLRIRSSSACGASESAYLRLW